MANIRINPKIVKFYPPELNLFRQTKMDEPDEYFLQVVTTCSQSNMRAAGHAPFPSSPDGDGVFRLTIYIKEDESLPGYEYPTPVVHSLELGSVEFEDGEGLFEVAVAMKSDSEAPGETKPVKKSTVRSTDADEDSRPILEV